MMIYGGITAIKIFIQNINGADGDEISTRSSGHFIKIAKTIHQRILLERWIALRSTSCTGNDEVVL